MSAFIPALRSSFLYLSKQPTLRRFMETSPAAERFTSRFIAGLELDDALRVSARLAGEKTLTTLDYLGENVTSIQEARRARDAYLAALHRLREQGTGATISVKVTALGLDLSDSECEANLATLVDEAHAMGSRVEMDMESTAYVDRTLDLVRRMHERRPGAVRAVIQAYLYRSAADIAALNREQIPVRLCKGAYQEPPELAFPLKHDVDQNYVRLMQVLLEEGTHPAIATHDSAILDHADAYAQKNGIAHDRFEFQMLYGVRRDLQSAILQLGYRLRLYVPYGSAWYPYFMRRLAERPANVGFILRNMLRQ